MTTPLPNMKAPLVRVEFTINGRKTFGNGFLIAPWNSFLQQFVQAGAAAVPVTPTGTPFTITANANGTMIILGGTVTSLTLSRGGAVFNLNPTTELVPIRIEDVLTIDYSVLPDIQFLPD